LTTNFQIPRGIPLRPVERPSVSQPQHPLHVPQNTGFNEILKQKIDETKLKFSAHAQKRMAADGITLNEHQMVQLEESVAKAAQKGGRETLILMNNLAFVVSVPNKTVITVINHDRLKENVFTNIDSAVIS